MAVEAQAKPNIQGNEQVGYDLSLFFRLRMMFSAFWNSPVRIKIISLTVALFLIILVTAYVQVLLNSWNAPFYDSLARRDTSAFFHQLGVFGIIAGSLLVLNVIQAWLNQMTALYMREGLARDLVNQWLQAKRALRLASSGLIGVNPDQRLHEDARNLAESTTGLAIGLVQATILLLSFIGVLWELSSGMVFHFRGASFSVPGYMVWAAILYAGSASFLSQFVGRRLVRLNADRYSKEAELRFALMHANEHMPAITIAGGEENERRRINVDISAVLAVIRQLAIANTNLTWVSAGYGWLVLIIPILVAAPAYFSGGLTFGQLMVAVGAFNQVNSALRWYVANFGPIAEWRATLMRVTDFRKALTEMDDKTPMPHTLVFEKAAPGTMVWTDMEISTRTSDEATENGFRIAEGTVTINAGEHIMVNGDHGVNRRLLFEVLAHQWYSGSGTVSLPPMEDVLFMPHTPYVPSGTLREAICFPEDRDVYDEAAVEAAMDKVSLGRLKSRLDTQARWDRLLDIEEQKAVGFAHLLLAKPKWVVLDDAMEGLEAEIQAQFSALLAELTDVTVIYIGRNEAYLHAMSPRVLHLQALVSRDEDDVAAATPPAAVPAEATVRDTKKANAP
ncbi:MULTISPECIES: ABC transporter ATP-binding protein/permease [Rhizobium]|jgi:putative ATP-binding cassette transporter|uniref:Putative ATP-binding cassette transporter n=1 Tax=Rhizobium lusitanum TaxID=293958 RepID=A0A1C3UEI4_9HYPH|nr:MULTISPECIES: ABC transporter ATP-binding protein/permease [Rhizobium]NKJ06001.1 putative ATP-binding cassette transporter [Rhizobium sp. SG741]NKJ35929.1 putative ATP-binding cassette transporter [Rhizobium sp. SG570]NTJ08829.1 ABC transporter ATP-binding protein/permease [Rhizobium lusitanum]SCB13882.1 putative ATP-binding cassette transporter [Rhizobium lusitanum]